MQWLASDCVKLLTVCNVTQSSLLIVLCHVTSRANQFDLISLHAITVHSCDVDGSGGY